MNRDIVWEKLPGRRWRVLIYQPGERDELAEMNKGAIYRGDLDAKAVAIAAIPLSLACTLPLIFAGNLDAIARSHLEAIARMQADVAANEALKAQFSFQVSEAQRPASPAIKPS